MFLLKYWKYLAAIALVLGVFGYWKSLTMKISSQEKTIIQQAVDIKISEANAAACVGANSEFKRIIDVLNQRDLALSELVNKNKLTIDKLNDAIKKKNAEIAIKDGQLAAVPWDQLDCPEQVNACYEILRGRP
jgi:hypothetical protein